MPVLIAVFGQPEDITTPGSFEGKVFRFPVKLIDRDDIGTPREPSKTKSRQVKASITASRVDTWSLSENDLIKVAFEIVKENLAGALNSSSASDIDDLEVRINTVTHKGPCPYDPTLIQEPAGAVVEIEIKRPIGFI